MSQTQPTDKNFVLSPSPHIHSGISVKKIMWVVSVALIPSGIAGVVIFGIRALYVVLTCILSAVLTEALVQKLRGKEITISDGSAFLTGLLLGYNLPANIPLWMAALGSTFAIAVAKQAFGGLGHNIFNPALAGRAFLQIAYPSFMASWPKPFNVDAVTGATPLEIVKRGLTDKLPTYLDLFLGNRGGCIGEVAVFALLLGALYLLIKGYIKWHIPVSYIATAAVFTWIFSARGGPASGGGGFFTGDALFNILSGGLILGAFFMATDYVTCPVSRKGKLVFGIGCGLLTAVIRIWSGYPEGVCYSILMMNAVVPFIDRFTIPRVLGKKGRAG